MPLFLIIIILKFYKHKKYLVKTLNSITIFSIISFVIFAPWLVKNLLFTGNPFYPFFGRFFPSRYLNQAPGEFYLHIIATLFKRNFLNLLFLPWNLTMKGAWGDAISPLYLIFVPFLLIIKKAPKAIRHILIFSFFYLIVGFYSLLWMSKRYLLQIFPLLSIVSAFAAYYLIDKDKILKYFISLLLFFCILFNLVLLTGQNYFKFPVVFGFETRDQYLSRRVPTYETIKYLNQSKDVKMVLFLDERPYYSDKPYLLGSPLDQGLVDYSQFKDLEELLEEFNRLKISHLFIHEPWLEKRNRGWAAPFFEPFNKLWKELKSSNYLKLRCSKNETYLYEILYPKIKR